MTAIRWPGTTEQRAERRGLNVGRANWPRIRHNQESFSKWIPSLRERTPKRDRWIWATRFLGDKSESIENARAQQWGLVMVLDRWAQGQDLEWWPRYVPNAEALDEWVEAWLWCDDCLKDDGWTKVTVEISGKPMAAWTRHP